MRLLKHNIKVIFQRDSVLCLISVLKYKCEFKSLPYMGNGLTKVLLNKEFLGEELWVKIKTLQR